MSENDLKPCPFEDLIRYLHEQFPATEGHIPLREKVGELKKLTRASGWMPIEGAPKWEPVLLLLPESYTQRVTEGYYNENTPGWWTAGGRQCSPTHFQHLPEPLAT